MFTVGTVASTGTRRTRARTDDQQGPGSQQPPRQRSRRYPQARYIIVLCVRGHFWMSERYVRLCDGVCVTKRLYRFEKNFANTFLAQNLGHVC